MLAFGEIDPPLEPNDTVLSILNDLASNGAARLPTADVLGDFNEEALRHNLDSRGPRYRNFCTKMAWASDRERAIYAGANHGVPHRLNDVWEYDLAANTWYLLYAPDPSVSRGNRDAYEAVREYREHKVQAEGGRTLETVTLRHTQRGGPSGLSHTYWGITYDPVRRAMLWTILRANRGGSYEGIPVWAFIPESREWDPVLTPPPRPGSGGISALEYVDELGGTVRYSAGWQSPGMWVLSSQTNQWKALAPNDGVRLRSCTECPGPSAVFAYSPAARLIVAVEEERTYHYDIQSDRWTLSMDGEEEGVSVPVGHYGNSVFGYEPAGDVFLLYDPESHGTVWAYDHRKRAWTGLTPDGPAPPEGDVIGYVDPARGVLVLIQDRDVWVYRYADR